MMKIKVLARIAALLFCLGALPVLASNNTVVFVGDIAPSFAGHSNWVNKTTTAVNSQGVRARFPSDIASHPYAVVIVVGGADVSAVHDGTILFWLDNYIQNVTAMIQEANAAGVRVILGTELPTTTSPFKQYFYQMNAWTEGYGSTHGIPVINSDHLTTDITENIIETLNLSLKSGYLSNSLNLNTFGGSQQSTFIPTGVYSDGKARPVLNTDIAGASGVWTSSNPAVLYVDAQGNATALGAGKSRVWFVSFGGIIFSPFDVTVTSVCPSTMYCNQP